MLGKNLRTKSSKNKIFRGFHVFEYALWQKTKTENAGNQQKAF